MDITIHSSFLPHDDPEASLAFYRDTLGFEVRLDVGQGAMRWITVGPPDQPGTNIVLYPPTATPGLTDDERRTIAEMMAKGTFATLLLATHDLDTTFDKVLQHWLPLTYALNALNRGMGLPDLYPFVLLDPAIEKLQFVHEVVQ